jgi:hypothetical protein
MNAEELIQWLEDMHTLHCAVEALYVVDGYEVSITIDGEPIHRFKADTLKEAYLEAAKACPKPFLRS